MPAVIEVKIVPVGTETPSFSSYVSDCIRVAEREGVRCQVTPTSTIIEGDLARCMDVARKMHQACFRDGCDRVVTNIAIDERVDKTSDMRQMVASVTTAGALR